MYSWMYSIYLISLLGACKSHKEPRIVPSQVNVSTDTVIKDIPRYPHGKPTEVYQKKKITEEKVGLTSLEEGFDTMQIRIWYGVALIDSSQLIILKKDGAKWMGQLYRIEYKYDKKSDSLIACSKKIDKIIPRSGWDDFIQKLFELKILTMRDAIEIPDYEVYNDGDGITFEIATKEKYRFYNYYSFRQQKGIWQAVNVEKIMKLLENEFSFKRISLHK